MGCGGLEHNISLVMDQGGVFRGVEAGTALRFGLLRFWGKVTRFFENVTENVTL